MKTPANTASSFLARRKLVKRRVKAAVHRAALKKKQQWRLECRRVAKQPAGNDLPEYDYGVYENGEFFQLTRGFLINSGGLLYYLPVVDNHGFLLGEFSKLDDDLSFVQDENPLPDTSSSAFSEFNWATF